MHDIPQQAADAESALPAAAPTADPTDASRPGAEPADLERIEADLAGVESALERLDAGTYWSDEVTGAPLSDALLITDPVARRGS